MVSHRVGQVVVALVALCCVVGQSADAQTREGLSIGVISGFARGSMRSNDGTIETNPAGELHGVRLGYTKLVSGWSVGAEVDFAASTIDGTERVTFGGYETAFDSDHSSLSTLRARVGRAVGRGTLYGTGGVAFSKSEATVAVRGPNNEQIGVTAKDVANHVGWVLGAGIEVPFTDRLSLTAEVLRIDFPKEMLTFDIGVHSEPMKEQAKFDMNALRIGMNFRR